MRSRHEAMCQLGRWAPKGVDLVGSHINWRKERVLVRTLGPEGGGLGYPTLVGEENETPFIRVWKPFPSRRVLKP